ncbi:copper-translocating P-type ATPase [Anderseniella sp. Alg231-50]|uniref:copper-translocating P-type ATPase n=1 Tax=Anderseniella sp. Alg231-50 TaxID=1922226 RepID=UPI000D54AFC0
MTCCSASSVPSSVALKHRLDHERMLAASHTMPDGSVQTDFIVPAMHCVGCIRTIERGLAELPDVKNARANLSTKRVTVQWQPQADHHVSFLQTLSDLGFEASLFDLEDVSNSARQTGRQLLVCLAVAGFAAANVMLLSVSVWSGADAETEKLFQLISGLIAVPACLFAVRPFLLSALGALRNRRLNMDVPISLAVLMALGMSVHESLIGHHEAYFDASVTLLFFLLIGRYLDHMMRERAHSAIMQLSRLVPSGAVRLSADGAQSYVSLGDLCEGDEIMVAAGERIPVDASVIDGFSDLDRSLVTGESASVAASPGLEIEAGVLNLSGPLTLRVVRSADKSFVAEVMAMMEAAEHSKSGYVRIADRAARIYAPVVHILAALSFAGWMVATGGDWHTSIYVSIAVLIITCPCALGLAVPIAQVVAANRLYRSGVMVKDGAALEKLAEVDTAVFDKTGTLTLGMPHISSVEGGGDTDHALASLLAGLSSHPAAKAVAGLRENRSGLLLSDVAEHAGFGLEAVWKAKKIRLGRRDWVAEIAAPQEPATDHEFSEVCFAVAGGDLVSFRLSDTLRADAPSTIAALRAAGLDLEVLSGDADTPVQSAAATLGISRARAALKPADKLARIEELQRAGHKVLYAGDGLNDAPALSAAHVSIAPASGSDVGRASSDLVFTGKGLGSIMIALSVARRTGRTVRQNFALAISYNCIAIPFAVLGHVTPLIAAIAMSASSIVVVANSLRLNLVNRDEILPATTASAARQETMERGPRAPARLEVMK